MATYFARKTGNINASDVWATTPTGTAAAVTFASGDVLMANSFTITVNVSTNLGSTGQFRNDTANGATLGGTFALGFGVTITGDIYSAFYLNGFACVSSSTSANIVGNITVTTSGNASSLLNRAVIFSGTVGATTTITGNISCPSALNNCRVIDFAASGGQLSIIGNLSGNSSSGNNCILLATSSASTTGSIIIDGTINAGASHGLNNISNNVPVTVSGIVTGGNTGFFGILNSSTSTITANALCIGGVGGAGIFNASTGTAFVNRAKGNAYGLGNTAGLSAAVGAENTGLGIIEIQEVEYGTYGMSPTIGTGIRLKKVSTNQAIFNYCNTAGAKTLIDATQNASMPAVTDVRHGVSYASGALTGSCAVPAAGSVALGVAVDATTGTAVLTPEAVWSAANRTITGGTVDVATTLTNAPVVPSAATIASQVRTELTSELSKISALNTTRLSQCATTEIVGNLLAQANS